MPLFGTYDGEPADYAGMTVQVNVTTGAVDAAGASARPVEGAVQSEPE